MSAEGAGSLRLHLLVMTYTM